MKKKSNVIMTEETPRYVVDPNIFDSVAPILAELQKKVVQVNKEIDQYLKEHRFNYDYDRALTSPTVTELYLINKLSLEEKEIFVCLFLDNQHNLLRCESLFSGTIDGASVYPREVIKRALELNAAALIFAHNDTSGICEPSEADKHITEKLKSDGALFDIRILDYFIIGGTNTYSFAEHGLI